MVKKPFINKKTSKTYKVVYRSQKDPLAFEEGESAHILAEIAPSNVKRKKTKKSDSNKPDQDALEKEEPAALYGIYTDDLEYDYTKHLKEIGLETEGENSVFIEAPAPKKSKKFQDDLFGMESSSEQSSSKKKVTFSIPDEFTYDTSNKMDINKEAFPLGLQPNMDPSIREALDALENVEDYETDSDADSFFDKLNDSDLEMSEEEGASDLEEGFENDEDLFNHIRKMNIKDKYNSSDDDYSDSEDMSDYSEDIASKRSSRSYRSAAPKSNFSMTSSVMYRNDNLTLLDDQFDNLEREYDEMDYSESEEEKEFTSTRPDFQNIMDKFLGQISEPEVKGAAILEKMRKEMHVPTSSEDAKKVSFKLPAKPMKKSPAFERVVVKESSTRPLWDAQSVFSSVSNLENHPVVIKHKNDSSINKIRLNKKGFPIVESKIKDNSVSADEDNSDEDSEVSDNKTKKEVFIRSKDETKEDKLARKKAAKQIKKEKRDEKKAKKSELAVKKSSLAQSKLNRLQYSVRLD
ncbi:Protein LTV1-like protein [Smittium culicis]|uniref:Protein LTV1-like protein n=1 Tax=Smittium culicis TaxID=133412 RepID=A0A1R1YEW9_9FUNG|nr:Protein LTV1-like protein [Smittium culicis]